MSKNKWLFFDCFGVVVCEVSEIWMKNHRLDSATCNNIRNEIFPLNDTGAITFKKQNLMLEKASGINGEAIQKEWTEIEAKNQELVDLIKKLHTDYHIAMLSNASSEHLRPMLERLGVTDLFDKIFVSSEMGMRKPEPEIFLAALEECGCEPSNATMIDDRQVNIDGAKNVGMNGILYTSVDRLEKLLLIDQ